MGQIFEPYQPDQLLLFPPSPRDWLPTGHLAFFVSETVEQLELSNFYAKYEQRQDGRGNCAYEPRLMLKMLIYAYCTGIFSSRKMAAGVEANASKHKALSYGRLKSEEQRLRREIRRITALARSADQAEDEEFGPD